MSTWSRFDWQDPELPREPLAETVRAERRCRAPCDLWRGTTYASRPSSTLR